MGDDGRAIGRKKSARGGAGQGGSGEYLSAPRGVAILSAPHSSSLLLLPRPPSPRFHSIAHTKMASKQSKCLFRLPFLLLLLFAQCAAVPHRHRRHHHHHGWDLEEAGHHLIVKNALNECKVPSECRHKIKLALLDQTQVPQCEHVDYFDLLLCLDRSIMSRTNVTELNSRSGQVCCEEIDEVSAPCQQACRSALYAPTLGHEQKLKRIEMVCNRKHGDGIRGDNGLITCLANTHWLVPKHKVMRR